MAEMLDVQAQEAARNDDLLLCHGGSHVGCPDNHKLTPVHIDRGAPNPWVTSEKLWGAQAIEYIDWQRHALRQTGIGTTPGERKVVGSSLPLGCLGTRVVKKLTASTMMVMV